MCVPCVSCILRSTDHCPVTTEHCLHCCHLNPSQLYCVAAQRSCDPAATVQEVLGSAQEKLGRESGGQWPIPHITVLVEPQAVAASAQKDRPGAARETARSTVPPVRLFFVFLPLWFAFSTSTDPFDDPPPRPTPPPPGPSLRTLPLALERQDTYKRPLGLSCLAPGGDTGSPVATLLSCPRFFQVGGSSLTRSWRDLARACIEYMVR